MSSLVRDGVNVSSGTVERTGHRLSSQSRALERVLKNRNRMFIYGHIVQDRKYSELVEDVAYEAFEQIQETGLKYTYIDKMDMRERPEVDEKSSDLEGPVM